MLYTLGWNGVLVVTGTFERLTDLVIFATFPFYGLTAVAILKTKWQGQLFGPARGYPVLQIALLLFALTLLLHTLASQPKELLLGVGLMATGLPFYAYLHWWARQSNSLPNATHATP